MAQDRDQTELIQFVDEDPRDSGFEGQTALDQFP